MLFNFRAFNISRWRGFVASALALLSISAFGQQQRREHKGPRAIAVVEFSAAHQPQKLLPVAIFYNGNYFDGTIYEATPVPMSVEPGNVYEVEQSGAPLGLFTISEARQRAGNWFGVGSWQEEETEVAANPKSPAATAGARKEDEDERPILKRPGSQSTSQNSGSTSQSSASSENENDERPVLKRPSSSSSSGQSSSTPQPAQNPPEVAINAGSPAYKAEQQDPNRPVLRRGKPQPSAPAEEEPPAATKSSSAQTTSSTAPTASTAAAPELFAAVSDAEPGDSRSYKFPWTPAEQTKLARQMSALALKQAEAYERQHSLPIASGWANVTVRAFDLFTDNDAELVLTGTQEIAGPRAREVFVTFVGFYGVAGELHQLFSEVTDSDHLDVTGRLELIDAVDSTGSGHGDLLFRRIGLGSEKFEIYRVTRDQLWKLFDGAEVPLGS